MCFCKRGIVFLLFGIWLSCGATGGGISESIRGELVKLIEKQGLREGVDRQTGSVVGIGISWSEKDPALAARNLAAAGICEIKNSSPAAIRTAVRMAEIKARRYLSLHFCQYNRVVENLSSEINENDETPSRRFTSVGLVKNKGVIAPGLGVMDVMEKIVTEDGRRFAICVTCLSRIDEKEIDMNVL